jgi:hydroxyacylglutathione hydrolase
MKTWQTKSGYTIRQVLGGRCNVFSLSNGNNKILIDTGWKSSRLHLATGLEELGIYRLDALILTHSHFDHVENAAFVREIYGPKVIVHKSEAEFLESGNSPLPGGTIKPAKLALEWLGEKVQEKVKYEPCKADILVEDEFSLSDYGFEVRIVHTPGHSPGSVSVIIDDEIALAGDTLYGAIPSSAFPPFADDADELIKSWGKLLESRCEIFLPAHGFQISREVLEKCYKHRVR